MRVAMIPALVLGCLAQSAVATGASAGVSVTPIQKVIEMLSDMLAKGKEEKHQEQVRFTSLKQWCESVTGEKSKLIKETSDTIEQLLADISKAEADADKLGEEITELDASIAQWTKESNEATAVRKSEASAFNLQYTDYSESIDALERAIATLKKRGADVPQALMQVDSVLAKKGHMQAHVALQSFLQKDADGADGVPEANAYEFQSSGVVDMLEKLRGRFIEEREVLKKEEMNTKHAYQMMEQHLADDIKYAEGSSSEKKQLKAQRIQDSETAKGDLAEAKASLEADQTYLSDTTVMCNQKSADFEQRQVLRGEELEAISKAIEIISSGAVSGAGDKHLPAALLQRPKALAQLRKPISALQQQVVALLNSKAALINSRMLATVALRVGEDPFGKVKKMIKDLITKLMEEANEEADHKGWCDEELATNKASRDSLTAEASDLAAKVDELTALEGKLSQDISDLGSAIKDLSTAMSEATEQRNKEKATNTVTIAEAKQAQAAVSSAITVLKEFYAKAGEATALVQRQSPDEDSPFAFDKPYKGMQGENGGVMGMLEVIASDFARLEAKTTSAEMSGQSEYDTFMSDSDTDKAAKEKEMRQRGFEKTRCVRDLNQNKKDLEGTQAELDTALGYFEKLKPSCLDNGLSYEDRVKRREAEIQSLQEALKILDGEDLSGSV